mmetsp:Transcript_36521/g.91045  ORF Transcript_36521/g.91045 Transcript_36521/m.91045 type:complete len:260 (+) Transcript_36521:4719-5498(+)
MHQRLHGVCTGDGELEGLTDCAQRPQRAHALLPPVHRALRYERHERADCGAGTAFHRGVCGGERVNHAGKFGAASPVGRCRRSCYLPQHRLADTLADGRSDEGGEHVDRTSGDERLLGGSGQRSERPAQFGSRFQIRGTLQTRRQEIDALLCALRVDVDIDALAVHKREVGPRGKLRAFDVDGIRGGHARIAPRSGARHAGGRHDCCLLHDPRKAPSGNSPQHATHVVCELLHHCLAVPERLRPPLALHPPLRHHPADG